MDAPTKAEVAALLATWKRLEEARARALLRAESGARKDLQAVVRTHAGYAADRLSALSGSATRFSKGLALSVVHSTSTALQAAAAEAIVDGRTAAREASQSRTAVETEYLSRQVRRDGWEELPEVPAAGDASADILAASSAASSLSARWSSASLLAIAKWEDNGASLPGALRGTSAFLAPQVERIAATEIAAAFAEEQLEALEELSDYPWAAQVFKVWSGMLDGRICQRCYEMDGETVPLNKPWKGGAYLPMHPHCRCMEVPLYIPKPKRLQDVATDYAAYKAEIRDQIRESRSTRSFGRTAGQFVERSRVGRSPTVISKDFATGRLARRTGF